MREALKKLTGESVIYGLGQVSGRAVQLLLVPVLTRVLAQDAYGVAELVFAYMQTAVLVLVFGMDGALARFFYQEPDRAARIRMVSSSLLFRVATTGVVAIAAALAAAPLAGGALGGEVYRKYVLIAAGTLPCTLLVLFANDVLRVTFQPWKFIALNLCQTVTVAGVTLWLVLAEGAGVAGVLYGRLAGDLVSAAFGLVLVRHTLRPHLRLDVLRRMLGYGVPLVPVAFAYGAIASVDRFVLQRTRSLEEVAIYAVAMKFFALVTMGLSAFQLAYGPFAFARAGQPDAPRLYARVFTLFMAVGGLGALAASLFAGSAIGVLAPEAYAPAVYPAVWLAFAALAQGAYYVGSIGIGLALRTPLLGIAAGAAALAAVLMNVWLAPRYGAEGAAVATLVAYGVSAVLSYRVAQRVHPIPYRGGRVLVLFVTALVLARVTVEVAPAGIAGVGMKLVVLAAFAAVCAVMRVWTNDGAVSPRTDASGTPPAAR